MRKHGISIYSHGCRKPSPSPLKSLGSGPLWSWHLLQL